MKRLILISLVAAVCAPASFAASPPSAQTDCTKLRASMGTAVFAQAYPTFGACVSKYAPVEQQSTTSAQTTCSAQQADGAFAAAHGGKTFDQFYGTGKNGKNAFGNCVSTAAKLAAQTEQQGRMNPSRTCGALRTQLTASVFGKTYRNYGACVSKTAQAQVNNEVAASNACATEQRADTSAFAQKY